MSQRKRLIIPLTKSQPVRVFSATGGSPRRSGDLRQLLLPPPLHRAADADGLAVFRDGAAGEVEALRAQQVDELVVGQDVPGILGVAQGADLRLDRLGRDRA